MAVAGALPRGEATRIVREGILAAHPWLNLHTRQDRSLPASLPLTSVRRLIAGMLGWDALSDLRSFSVKRGAVVAEAYAVDQSGSRFLSGGDVAVDLIHIPINEET